MERKELDLLLFWASKEFVYEQEIRINKIGSKFSNRIRDSQTKEDSIYLAHEWANEIANNDLVIFQKVVKKMLRAKN